MQLYILILLMKRYISLFPHGVQNSDFSLTYTRHTEFGPLSFTHDREFGPLSYLYKEYRLWTSLLFMHGIQNTEISLLLFTHGIQNTEISLLLFTHGIQNTEISLLLFTHGIQNSDFSLIYTWHTEFGLLSHKCHHWDKESQVSWEYCSVVDHSWSAGIHRCQSDLFQCSRVYPVCSLPLLKYTSGLWDLRGHNVNECPHFIIHKWPWKCFYLNSLDLLTSLPWPSNFSSKEMK
jgi:hypothetical protein